VASAAIALALLAVAIVAVPLRLWASRLASSVRSPRRAPIRRADAPGHLAPGLRRLVRLGRELVAAVEQLRPITVEYRRTLPYLSLFFADDTPSRRHDRWIRDSRESFEHAVSDVAIRLRRWHDVLTDLSGSELATLLRAGGHPHRALALLDDGTRLPKTYREARRFRFCEDWEVDRLLEDLDAIAGDMRGVDAALCAETGGPYRRAAG
jgi:hypothetical protein